MDPERERAKAREIEAKEWKSLPLCVCVCVSSHARLHVWEMKEEKAGRVLHTRTDRGK